MTELPLHADISSRTLEHYGRALLIAQYLEVALINTYLFVEVVPKKRHLIEDQEEWVSEIYQSTNSMLEKTLGGMIQQILKTDLFSDDVKDILKTALASRNQLSHGFFVGRPFTKTTTRTDLQLYTEIETHMVNICKAAEMLEDTLDRFRRFFGLEEMHLSKTYATIRSHYDHAP